MNEREALRVGVVGLGFMGRTHVRAYARAAEAGHANRLVAVSDPDLARLTGRAEATGNIGDAGQGLEPLFDPDSVKAYASADELIESGELDLVSICTPTDTHVELATRALKAGLHVLLEKPVALNSASVAALQAAAKKSGKLCMPAMCMRFWPAWAWLKGRVDSGAFGAVTSAAFRRLGTRPGWNNSFYGDADRCGGALFDLHVHDADFVRWLLGEPTRVLTTGTLDHMSTFYRFENGPKHAYAEGGWDHADGYPFLMGYVVVFEDATADFVLKREPQLRLSRGGKYEVVKTPDIDGYDGEVRYFLDAVAKGEKKLTATLEQAVGLTRMLEAERQSLETGDWVDAR